MKTALLLLGLATLGACRKRDTPPAPEPGEPGQGYEGEPGPQGGEPIPRLVQPPPSDLPPQPPEVVLGPCRLTTSAGGGDAPYAAAVPGELQNGMGGVLACYRPPRVASRADLALVIAQGGKLAASVHGAPRPLADCLSHAIAMAQLSAPPSPDLGVTCELAFLPEHGLAHQPLEAAPLLRLTDALRQDGQPVTTLRPGRVLLEPDAGTPVRAVMAALASPALTGHEVAFVVARGGRRYQLAALRGRPPQGPGAMVWVARDSLWVGASEADRRQIRNQEPGAYDFTALTATLGKLRAGGPLWFRLDAAIAADDAVSYDTLTHTIEAALAAGFVDFRVVPRAALPATFAR